MNKPNIILKDKIGKVLYRTSAQSVKEAVEKAVRKKTDLGFVVLNDSNFREAHLANAKLYSAYLGQFDFCGADLSEAVLDHTDFGHANLAHAYLYRANLKSARLTRADLSHANLSYADLSEADLSGANLTGANLSYANLAGANVEHALMNETYWDFSAWPLSCGGTRARIDRRIGLQLCYHFVNQRHRDPEVAAAAKRLRSLALKFIKEFRRDATEIK